MVITMTRPLCNDANPSARFIDIKDSREIFKYKKRSTREIYTILSVHLFDFHDVHSMFSATRRHSNSLLLHRNEKAII